MALNRPDVFSSRWIVLRHSKVDRPEQVLKLRTSEGHGLCGTIVERTVWSNDKDAGLTKQSRFFNANGRFDLPPINRATEKLVKSDIEGVVGHEEAVYG